MLSLIIFPDFDRIVSFKCFILLIYYAVSASIYTYNTLFDLLNAFYPYDTFKLETPLFIPAVPIPFDVLTCIPPNLLPSIYSFSTDPNNTDSLFLPILLLLRLFPSNPQVSFPYFLLSLVYYYYSLKFYGLLLSNYYYFLPLLLLFPLIP